MFCCYHFKDLSKTSGKNQLEANLSELNSSWLLKHSDQNPRFLSKFSGKKSLKFFDFRIFFVKSVKIGNFHIIDSTSKLFQLKAVKSIQKLVNVRLVFLLQKLSNSKGYLLMKHFPNVFHLLLLLLFRGNQLSVRTKKLERM